MKHAKSGRSPALKPSGPAPSQSTQRALPRIELSHEPLKTVTALRQKVAAIKLKHRISPGRAIAKGRTLQQIGEVETLFKRAYAAFEELQRDLSRHEALRGVIVSIDKGLAGEIVAVRLPAPSGARAGMPAATEAINSSGLERARARGQKALAQWVKEGALISSPEFAEAWGVSRQALEQAVQRGALFSVKHAGRRYYPRAPLELETEPVALVCQALGALPSSEKLLFWLSTHGALRGLTPAQAMQGGRLERVVEHAAAWANERSATHAAVDGGCAVHG
jgi:hypothetical protein